MADIGRSLVERRAVQSAAAAAAAATRVEMPHGGGTAAAAAEATAAGLTSAELRNLRVTPNLAAGAVAPKFVSSRNLASKKGKGGKASNQVQDDLEELLGTRVVMGTVVDPAKGAWSKRGGRKGRAQGTAGEDIFDQFAEDVQVSPGCTVSRAQSARLWAPRIVGSMCTLIEQTNTLIEQTNTLTFLCLLKLAQLFQTPCLCQQSAEDAHAIACIMPPISTRYLPRSRRQRECRCCSQTPSRPRRRRLP